MGIELVLGSGSVLVGTVAFAVKPSTWRGSVRTRKIDAFSVIYSAFGTCCSKTTKWFDIWSVSVSIAQQIHCEWCGGGNGCGVTRLWSTTRSAYGERDYRRFISTVMGTRRNCTGAIVTPLKFVVQLLLRLGSRNSSPGTATAWIAASSWPIVFHVLLWRIQSSVMLRSMALIRNDVSEELLLPWTGWQELSN
jgi:hypothetical protein